MSARLLMTGVITSCLLGSLVGSAHASPWKLEKDRNGIQVYTRAVPGSALKEFRAVTRINAPLPVALALIEDVNAMCSWLADCKQARTLKTVSASERYNYVVISAPFPVSNRDMVIRA